MIYNPLNLVNVPTQLEIDETTVPQDKDHPDGAPACGSTQTKLPDPTSSLPWYESYKIILYMLACEDMHRKSLAYELWKLSTLVFAVLCHEVAHIVAQSFSVIPYVRGNETDSILHYLDNVIEDARTERVFMYRFSRYAPYIQLWVSTMKWAIGGNDLADSGIVHDLQTIFYMARFGMVQDGSDPDLVTLAFPLLINSERGNRQNCVDAVLTLYTYLAMKYAASNTQDQQQYQQAKGAAVTLQPMSEEDAEMVADGQVVMGDGANKQVLQDVMGVKQGTVLPEHVAGSGGPPLTEEEQPNDDFYESTVQGHAFTIIELRNALLRTKYQLRHRRSYEGELSLKRQSQLYVDSLVGEESRNYHVFQRQIPDIQAVVLWDVSDSTKDYEEPFARSIACILAALDGEPGVETALIEFNSRCAEIMGMGGDVKKTRIFPHHDGGTAFLPALCMAFGGTANIADWFKPPEMKTYDGYNWKAREKYLIIVTDGDAVDITLAAEMIEEKQRELGIVPMLFNVCPGASDCGSASHLEYAEVCRLEELPERVMGRVLGHVYK